MKERKVDNLQVSQRLISILWLRWSQLSFAVRMPEKPLSVLRPVLQRQTGRVSDKELLASIILNLFSSSQKSSPLVSSRVSIAWVFQTAAMFTCFIFSRNFLQNTYNFEGERNLDCALYKDKLKNK